jgi:NADPH:quinone reductase-like Zn-dependent oxidoreductase
MSTMKAVAIERYGDARALKYTDVSCLELTDDTVLIKVHATGINPVDWKTSKCLGMARRYGENFPLIIG